MGEKLSIVIPVYRVEQYLRQCLNSVVNQTYRNLEIIIVEDGSPDNCGAICDEYAAKDERIRTVHKQNAGVSAARNDGIRLATGDWIAFVDADDWLETDYVESMFSAMPEGKVDVLCSSGYVEEHFSKSVVKRTFPEPFVDRTGEKRTFLIAKAMAKYLDRGNQKRPGSNAPIWNRFYQAELLQNHVPAFDENLHPIEDTLYSMRVFAQARTVAVVDCVGYHYRKLTAVSSTSRFNPDWPHMFEVQEKSMTDFIAEQGASPLLIDAFCASEIGLTGLMLRCYFFHPENPAPYPQIANEIREFKRKPCVSSALYRKSNRFLSRKHVVLKYALCLPCVWPLSVLCTGWRVFNRVKSAAS